MTAKTSRPTSTQRAAGVAESVEDFIARLDHPFKREILDLRQAILGADPAIVEGIKWNAPSFRTSEYFATIHLHAKVGVQLILHRGAKVRDGSIAGGVIDDPESLLEWLGNERATVKFRDAQDIHAKRNGFRNVIRAWIKHV